MPRVIHFEIHADDPPRAMAYYQKLLGWEFTKFGGPMEYYLISSGPKDQPGIDGGLMKRQGPSGGPGMPIIAYICTVDVPDLDAYMQRAVELGGKVCLAKMPIPGVGWLGYVSDTEGNIFGMMQPDANAGK